ncbi:helix-turn-helix transcriptional regulator [Gemmobacter sp.]|uniref:helix-turn-helix domain-containing protein n=1 Tax=Gemmobacter sp. TaxID=1898957 RepID=UPI002AFDE21C|nr:helix-turn-helix transcriptional regulator [Gemmobacter sp.]
MAKQPWTKARIKCALEERGMTMTGLAELKGINPNNFRAVWSRTVRPAEQAISEFLGVPAAELFPDRYPIRKSSLLSKENEALIASQKAAREADRAAAA